MISSEVEQRKITLSIEQHNSLDAKHEEPLDITKTRRKSVENLVISSQDAIGQSISNALSFSGAITQQAAHIVSQDHRSVSRSPSPCRRILESSIAECSDDGLYETPEPQGAQISMISGDTTQGSDGSQNKSTDIQYRNSTSPPVALRGAEGRSKKKSWYSSLYPTYKSRSDDFKRLFKDLPDEERLIVDYSCALQKDILVQGRLYASQNYLCFYANIFGWETSMSTRWKDVTAITKEKTALVIPNAILICTNTEKNFLTSFHGRDKTFLMLFRIWQNALLDQQISSQDIWQWINLQVHSCYGEELGFGSDDDDYREYMDEEKVSAAAMSLESASEEFRVLDTVVGDRSHSPPILVSETLHLVATAPGSLNKVPTRPHWARSVSQPPPSQPSLNATPPTPEADGELGDGEKFVSNGADTLPTDMSDSSESEPDKQTSSLSVPRCMDSHVGRAILSMEVSVHIDQLFTMLFTNSKFCLELLATRNTSDYSQSSWSHNSETGLKCREVKYTMALTQAVGPKSTHVTENQVMNSCSKPGQVYSIDITTSNAGVPYGDSFYVVVHYCLNRITEHVTHLQIIAQIKYKKTVWGIVKGFIEKNTWSGLEEYCVLLNKALLCEADGEHGTHKRKTRRRRRCPSASSQEASGPVHNKMLMGVAGEASSKRGSLPRTGLVPPLAPPAHRTLLHNCWLWVAVLGVLVLLLINYLLYTKLHHLHERRDSPFYPLVSFDETLKATALSPEMIAEWTQALQQQSSVHLDELERWRKTLNDYIMLIKQTESALSNLQDAIKSVLKKELSNNNAPANVEL